MSLLAQRLTPRDRYVMRMLYEHRVLTTRQIAELAFGSYSAAAHRLPVLYWLRAVDRFRLFRPLGGGSAPWHYILDEPGAHVIAAEDGLTIADLAYRHDRVIAIQHSRQLTHTIGVNGFFTALAAVARPDPSKALLKWWSERRCAQRWGDIVKPDAYARWYDDAKVIDFFLEYDTGTETLDRVVAKLDAYADLARTTGITTPVLFWFPTTAREVNFRNHLTQQPTVPAATAAAQTPFAASHPAAPVWLPLGQTGPRHRLIGLFNVQPRSDPHAEGANP
jgi:hypothetical protein